MVLSAFVWFACKWSNPLELSGKTSLFLGLSGLATGASWVCYFRALKIGDASKGCTSRLWRQGPAQQRAVRHGRESSPVGHPGVR